MSLAATRTIRKKNEGSKSFRPYRDYDHLYGDVSFCLTQRRVPEFGTMFSALPHYPQHTIQLNTTDPVPGFIDRRWQGQVEQRREALQVTPGVQSWLRKEECHVTGTDRWKYFKRPLIPFAHHVPPDVIFQQHPPYQVSVGVQTDYRDSEAQTDPYGPGYVIRPGSAPSELLALATLTWGRGLPAGLAEVEMIERVRARRAWEATLPPLNDLSQLDKRRRMIEEIETKEWAFREGEIQKLQEARLAVLRDLQRQREEAQKETTMERLNQKYSKLQRAKEAKLQKIHKDYIRSLRKLTAKSRNVEGKLERRDIIKEYTDYSSQTYAPLTRRGVFPDSNTRRNVVKSRFLDTYEGLLELEAGLPASLMEPCVRAPKHKVSKVSERRHMELMQKYKVKHSEDYKSIFVKKDKPPPCPVTPRVEEPPEGDEEQELGVIYLQKLLRGRGKQYQMFKGKEKRLELIQELRTTHALQKEEQQLLGADAQLTQTLKNQRDLHRHKASMVGVELVNLLDTLSKELIHLQTERRIHAFMLLAERERCLREAEESGRRQVEERRRREEDEIFRQLVLVHQDTVDLYLEDIILGTMELTADQQAREEIRRMAREVNDIVYDMEESRNNLQSEEIVSELVNSCLIPEVQRISVRQRVHQSQRRHLQAARHIIPSAANSSGVPPVSHGALQPTAPSDRASSQVLEEMISKVEQERSRDCASKTQQD
uniref:Cilia- and flagella-associated protein 91 n=1 Tax=Myripristis murdjan TaxID=586833 RepID=A0A667WZT9_9TELE